MTTKIKKAIEVLKCFDGKNKIYWIANYKGLTDSEKGFLLVYFNL